MSTLLGKLGEAKTNYYKAFGQNKIAKNACKNIFGKKVQNMVVNIELGVIFFDVLTSEHI